MKLHLKAAARKKMVQEEFEERRFMLSLDS
jgi:hypothetical protein